MTARLHLRQSSDFVASLAPASPLPTHRSADDLPDADAVNHIGTRARQTTLVAGRPCAAARHGLRTGGISVDVARQLDLFGVAPEDPTPVASR